MFFTGCFKGNEDVFLKAVESNHGNNAFAVEYRAAVEFCHKIFEVKHV